MPHPIETAATAFKHRFLRGLGPERLAALRRIYELGLDVITGGRGVPRRINGRHLVRVSPRHRFVSEHYEPEVLDLLERELRPGQVLYDVGAHIGIFSIICARLLGDGGRVVAFEPAPDAQALLGHHLALNAVTDRVAIITAGVGAQSGQASFAVVGDHIENTFASGGVASADEARRLTVRMTTVDETAARRAERVDWLKIDTEGWELHVLNGATATLASGARAVVEMHPYAWEGAGYTGRDIAGFCAAEGLEMIALTGQRDPLGEYGHVLVQADPGPE